MSGKAITAARSGWTTTWRRAFPQPWLTSMLHRLTELPDGFHLHHKLKRMTGGPAADGGRDTAAWTGPPPKPWPTPRFRVDGYRIRLSGQDSIRGTFSHRHAAFYDTEDGHAYFPLKNLSPEQMPVEIYNSPLREAGVLGFEYGYSLGYPDALVLWEAQFGDFANAAQVIIDQFIVSAEEKWRHLSGIVLLLPHGFEGQGPEHSSARVERFLRLGNEENVQVVVPSTPAQFFHVLRRQAIGCWKKPLVGAHAQEPAAASGLRLAAGGSDPRPVPAGDSRSELCRRPKGASPAVCCCAAGRYTMNCWRSATSGIRTWPCAVGAVSSAAASRN